MIPIIRRYDMDEIKHRFLNEGAVMKMPYRVHFVSLTNLRLPGDFGHLIRLLFPLFLSRFQAEKSNGWIK